MTETSPVPEPDLAFTEALQEQNEQYSEAACPELNSSVFTFAQRGNPHNNTQYNPQTDQSIMMRTGVTVVDLLSPCSSNLLQETTPITKPLLLQLLNEGIHEETEFQQSSLEQQLTPTKEGDESVKKTSELPDSQVVQANPGGQYETCAYCSRQFFLGRLALHQKSCKPSNPLKPLNLLKIHNIISSEAEHLVPKPPSQVRRKTKTQSGHYEVQIINDKVELSDSRVASSAASEPQILSKWRLEHESLMQNIKHNSVLATLDPILSQYVQCQYCSRKFKPQVAEQHIPNCKNINCRPKPPKILAKIFQANSSTESMNKPGLSQSQSQSVVVLNPWKSHQQSFQGSQFNLPASTPHSQSVQRNLQQNQVAKPPSSAASLYQLLPPSSAAATTTAQLPLSQSVISEQHSQHPIITQDFTLFCNQSNTSLVQFTSHKESQPSSSSTPNQFIGLPRKKSNKQDPEDIKLETSQINLMNRKSNKAIPVQQQNHYHHQSASVHHHSNMESSCLPSIFEAGSSISKQKAYRSRGTESKSAMNYDDVISRSENYSQVSCPYCDRKFAKQAASRHIPICKNILNRPPKLSKRTPEDNNNQPVPLSRHSSVSSVSISKAFLEKPHKENHYFDGSIPLQEIGKNFCTSCGSQLSLAHKYCGLCGKKRL